MKPIPSLFLLIALMVSVGARSQTEIGFDKKDLQLIRSTNHVDSTYCQKPTAYGIVHGKRTVSPFYHLYSSAYYSYERFLSPLFQHRCMHEPTCIEYNKSLLEEFGLLEGTFLIADRLMRCNRIALADKNNRHHIIEGNGKYIETTDRYRP